MCNTLMSLLEGAWQQFDAIVTDVDQVVCVFVDVVQADEIHAAEEVTTVTGVVVTHVIPGNIESPILL